MLRTFEPWMHQGARVTKAGQPGTIVTFNTSTLGESFGGEQGRKVVHGMIVQLDGAPHPFPYSANDVDPVKA